MLFASLIFDLSNNLFLVSLKFLVKVISIFEHSWNILEIFVKFPSSKIFIL